eukprot:scaffold124174_cov48-Phaeocystis_antarctica.AAC.3
MRIEARAGRREGVGQRRRKRHACGEGSAQEAGFQDTRGAHIEHAVHARNFRGVEAQRLVEARRALPSRKEGIRDAGRGARTGRWKGVGWWRRNRHARRGPD